MRAIILAAALFAAAPAAAAAAQDAVVVPAAPGALSLTIYGNGVALVSDRRAVDLRQGRNRLVFEAVGRAIVPESVMLRAADDTVRLIERSFDREPLTAQALLARSVGRTVAVRRVNPASGEVERRRGTLLSTDWPALVDIDGQVEAVDLSAIVFESVPPGLRAEPALVVEVEAERAGRRELELGYLTQGLSWRADYVLELAQGAPRMRLDAVATVTNESGTAFRGARLAFAAGDVNRVPPPVPVPRPVPMQAAREMKAGAPAMMVSNADLAQQAMAAAHLYRLDRSTDLGDRETKQVALLARAEVPVERQYVADPLVQAYHRRLPQPQEGNASLELVFRNAAATQLGVPLPAGVARVYQRDAGGELRFQGEDRVEHVAEGGEVRLDVGRDVDLPVKRTQTDFKRLGDDVSESRYEVRLRNAKAEEVTVRVRDLFGGDWQIVEESAPHTRETAQTALWQVQVPAKGEAVLRYTVRVKGY